MRFHSRGITLIEVLIAVIVLSIGLLGIAGLQVATAKYKIGSGARSAIAILYSDFTDRVRLNPDMAGKNWVTGGTAVEADSTNPDGSIYIHKTTFAAQQGSSDAELTSTVCDGANVCSPSERAQYDMLNWRRRVRENLPQGAVFVQGNRMVGIDVTLMWMDKENTDKSVRTDDGTTATQANLVAARSCSETNTESGMAQQTCCPSAAAVPAGVRCTRFSFMP